jgi:hypothetical protein
MVQYARLGAVVAVVVATTTAIDGTTSCKKLSDRSNPFLQSLGSFSTGASSSVGDSSWGGYGVDEILQNVETQSPEVFKCLANIDPQVLATKVMFNPSLSNCITAFNSTGSYNGDEPNAYFSEYFCPMYTKSLVPCVNDVMVKALTEMMDSVEGACCDDLKNKIKSNYGTDLSKMVNGLLARVGNVLCSVHTYTSTMTTSSAVPQEIREMCGATLFKAMNDPSMSMMDMAQIPTSAQMCAAVMGEPFIKTDGKQAQMFTSKNSTTKLDICFLPIADLLNHITNYPIMANMTSKDGKFRLLDFFQGDKCLNGGDLFQSLFDSESNWMKRMMEDMTGMARDGFETKDSMPMLLRMLPSSMILPPTNTITTGTPGAVSWDGKTESPVWNGGGGGSSGGTSGGISIPGFPGFPNGGDWTPPSFPEFPQDPGFPNAGSQGDTTTWLEEILKRFYGGLNYSNFNETKSSTSAASDDKQDMMTTAMSTMTTNISETFSQMENEMRRFCFHLPVSIPECKFNNKLELAFKSNLNSNTEDKKNIRTATNSANAHLAILNTVTNPTLVLLVTIAAMLQVF